MPCKFDAHVHTVEVSPCAKVSAEDTVRLYHEAGYDAIVITNHFSPYGIDWMNPVSDTDRIDKFLSGYRIAKKAGEKFGLRVYLGMELLLPESSNEYLVYGFGEDFLYRFPHLEKMPAEEFTAFRREHNLTVFQAHPFRDNMTRMSAPMLDGMETHNGNPRIDSRNYLTAQWAKEHDLIPISGSDFHQTADISRGGFYLPHLPADEKELARLLLLLTPEALIIPSEDDL